MSDEDTSPCFAPVDGTLSLSNDHQIALHDGKHAVNTCIQQWASRSGLNCHEQEQFVANSQKHYSDIANAGRSVCKWLYVEMCIRVLTVLCVISRTTIPSNDVSPSTRHCQNQRMRSFQTVAIVFHSMPAQRWTS